MNTGNYKNSSNNTTTQTETTEKLNGNYLNVPVIKNEDGSWTIVGVAEKIGIQDIEVKNNQVEITFYKSYGAKVITQKYWMYNFTEGTDSQIARNLQDFKNILLCYNPSLTDVDTGDDDSLETVVEAFKAQLSFPTEAIAELKMAFKKDTGEKPIFSVSKYSPILSSKHFPRELKHLIGYVSKAGKEISEIITFTPINLTPDPEEAVSTEGTEQELF